MVEICRRASAQGIGFTLPESSSSIRRAISWLQASSADASTVSSRLSSSEPASAARTSGGSARAFFRSSETSSVMELFYSHQSSPLLDTRDCSPNRLHLDTEHRWQIPHNRVPAISRIGGGVYLATCRPEINSAFVQRVHGHGVAQHVYVAVFLRQALG